MLLYKRIEKLIIVFVSLIGFSFLFEVWIADIDWARAAVGWVKPSFPKHSMPVILSVLGAVVMPHNLFLHSEIIQSPYFHIRLPQPGFRGIRRWKRSYSIEAPSGAALNIP